MNNHGEKLTSTIETLAHQISAMLTQPKADLEKNIKVLLSEAVSKMDLVTQDELDRQVEALARANQSLAELKLKIDTLENGQQK